MSDYFTPYIDEATYRGYAFNRMLHPEIDYTRWKTVYGPVEAMEDRFMREFLENIVKISY